MTYLIDARNIFGLQDFLINNLDTPFFWYHWFLTPVEEPLQWYMLGATFFVFSFIAGIAFMNKDKNTFKFWGLMSLGLLFMLVEDAGDVRHTYRAIITRIFEAEGYGFMGTIFELVYFLIIGLILLFAIYKYYSVYKDYKNTKLYLGLGYVFYGLGVSASFVGSAFNPILGFSVYERIGVIFVENIFLNNQQIIDAYILATEQTNINFMFMDRVFEESLELLGAAGLLCSGLYFLIAYLNKNELLK
ncbi:hypothetical protein I0Q91_05480 [Halanaerobiaceae bacterium Z-7014]|uniref:Uncharacterized protein n=1 Tax=Halonatronomonas betaini TaxID=2778430 RepID=A0A931AR21_9FIRM|nr:hypothetical protein [Halonatronomonas betaini]MBF8436519.1 hypothetical protein [Halonatronomonas betaini]